MKFYKRKNCRLCGLDEFLIALKLTPTPWADDYISKENLSNIQKVYSITVQICKACGHGQLTHVLNSEDICSSSEK